VISSGGGTDAVTPDDIAGLALFLASDESRESRANVFRSTAASDTRRIASIGRFPEAIDYGLSHL
jgi:hypothetical protein